MGTRKIAPALAAGCTVVLEAGLGDAAHHAGAGRALPRGGRAAGRRQHPALAQIGRGGGARCCKDPRVRVISFTGSTEVGRKLLHEAADMVVRPAMELGGNAPFIVCEDADIDAAVDGAMIAKMRNMGEACTAANRFYVHEKVHDAFVDKFAAKMKALKVGNGLEEGVAVGPLVNAEGRDKVVSLVEDALNKGAKRGARRRRAQPHRLFLSADRAGRRARRRPMPEGGDFRPGGADPEIPRRGRGDPQGQRHRIRPHLLRLYAGIWRRACASPSGSRPA